MDDKNPFPGIRPYQWDEAELFFGRADHNHELLRVLRQNHFVAVLGDSGSGKSSLVRAGTLPPLVGGFMVPEPGLWRIAILRPGGGDPTGALAAAICEDDENGWRVGRSHEEVLHELRRGGLGLIEVAKRAKVQAGSRFLVLVDQFEELFGFIDAPDNFEASDTARSFVTLLMEAAAQRAVPIYVIITMRSEYIGHAASLPDFTRVINDGLYLVPGLNRDQLRQAIEEPIRLRGATILPSVVNELLNDSSRIHDKMSVLGHALSGLWKSWWRRCNELGISDPTDPEAEPPPIGPEDYDYIGGLDGSLHRHLQDIFDGLSPEQQLVAEVLFRNLAVTRPDGTRVRRPTKLEDISRTGGVSEDDVRAVVEIFRRKGREFLTPAAGTPLDRDTEIDLAHEAIFRRWNTYARWVDDETADARLLEELERDANVWADGGKKPEDLLGGRRLVQAEGLENIGAVPSVVLGRAGVEAREEVGGFLEASIDERRIARVAKRRSKQGGAVAVLLLLVGVMWRASELQNRALDDLARQQDAVDLQAAAQREEAAEQALRLAEQGALETRLELVMAQEAQRAAEQGAQAAENFFSSVVEAMDAEQLISTLGNPEPDVRVRAAQLLERAWIVEGGNEALARALDDPVVQVRWAAMDALAHNGYTWEDADSDVVRALEEKLDDREEEVTVRIYAAHAIASRFGFKRVGLDPDADWQAVAAYIGGGLYVGYDQAYDEHREALDSFFLDLLEETRDQDPYAQGQIYAGDQIYLSEVASNVLGTYAGTSVIPSLESIVRSQADPRVRANAQRALDAVSAQDLAVEQGS